MSSLRSFSARLSLTCFIVLAIACCGSVASADTHYVDANSPSPGEPYASEKTAAHDIQAAVDAAEAGDTVRVAAGTYLIEKEIAVKKAITVQGAGADKSIIDAQSKCRGLSLAGGATFLGFTITGGKAREGGGVMCGAGATLAECTIIKNEAERRGGGVHARGRGARKAKRKQAKSEASPCLIRDCKIVENKVLRFMHTDTPWGGGGVFADEQVTVRNCLIKGNLAPQRAGGIWCHGGSALAENCTIIGNTASGRLARNSNGSGSMAEGGGGAYLDFGGQLRGCLITGNHAGGIGGGAVLSTNGRAKNCTIVGNTAGRSGGGVQTLGPGHVVSSIVVGNTRGGRKTKKGEAAAAGQPDDAYGSHYYHVDIHQLMLGTLNIRHSCVGAVKMHVTRQRFYLGRTAGYDPKRYKNTLKKIESLEVDPQFVDAAAGDLRLKQGSPCIDAGKHESWMDEAKDLDGQPRVQGEAVDMGAYERKPAA